MALFYLTVVLSSCSDDTPAQPTQDSQDQVLTERSTGCAIDLAVLDCPPINTLILTNFVHPDYPGCSFNISVDYVDCDPLISGFDGVYAGNYVINSHNCPQYVADLQDAAAQGDAALIGFVQDFSGPVYNELVFQLSLLDTGNDFNCDGNNFTVTWTKSQCTAVCVTEYDDGLTSHRTFNCANTGCCYSTSELCIDDEGTLIVNTTSVPTNLPANCGGGSPLVSTGPGGVQAPGSGTSQSPGFRCTYITKCELTCEG